MKINSISSLTGLAILLASEDNAIATNGVKKVRQRLEQLEDFYRGKYSKPRIASTTEEKVADEVYRNTIDELPVSDNYILEILSKQ